MRRTKSATNARQYPVHLARYAVSDAHMRRYKRKESMNLWWRGGMTAESSKLVGRGGRVVERRTVNRGDGGSHLPPFRNLGNYVHFNNLTVSFGRDTKSRWSLLSGVYARGNKRSHTAGKCVTCSGLKNYRWTLNVLQKAPSSI